MSKYRTIIIIILCFVLFVSCKKDDNRWDDGIVPLYLGFLSVDDQKVVISACNDWTVETYKAALLKKKKNLNVIHFKYAMFPSRETVIFKTTEDLPPLSNGSGERKGKYKVVLLNERISKNKRYVLHEIGHVLGLRHEHQRPDRDFYIDILWDEISFNYGSLGVQQFFYDESGLYDYKDYLYDIHSIMHYKEWEDDVHVIDGRGDDVGSDVISPTDAAKIVDIYSSL